MVTQRKPQDGSWVQRLLRTPLLTKLVLLDLVINAFAFLGLQLAPADYVDEFTLLSLVVVLVLNAALVAWALRPLQVLEQTARRVSLGEFSARADLPVLADRNLVRIGDTLNDLLDRVEAERGRVRALASELVAAGDQERARIARELHDGTAQSLSALDMLMSSTLSAGCDGPTTERLQVMRDIVTEALAERRQLSHTVHPRVLDDLGLGPALEFLARRTRVANDVEIEVTTDVRIALPPAITSVLYRVAQEAVHNAVKHGAARTIRIDLLADLGLVDLVVQDDGRGFVPQAIDPERRGMGLFVMEERVSLVDGTFDLETRPGGGTRIRAAIPVPEPA